MRRHGFDLGTVTGTIPANGMPLGSSSVFILGSAWLYLMLASVGLSSSLKPFSSCWHTATTLPIKPRSAVSAAGVSGPLTVRRSRLSDATGGATAR